MTGRRQPVDVCLVNRDDFCGNLAVNTRSAKRWLAQLSENLVDCVCGWSLFGKQENFFSAVFSKQFFHQKGTLKELQVKGNLYSLNRCTTSLVRKTPLKVPGNLKIAPSTSNLVDSPDNDHDNDGGDRGLGTYKETNGQIHPKDIWWNQNSRTAEVHTPWNIPHLNTLLFDVLFQTFSNLKLKQRKRNEKRKGLVTVFVKVFLVSVSKINNNLKELSVFYEVPFFFPFSAIFPSSL